MSTVLVCGGRSFGDIPLKLDRNGADEAHPDYPTRKAEYDFVITTLYKELTTPADNPCGYDLKDPALKIIAGGATGADNVAIEWAMVNWISCEEFPAEWTNLSRPGARIRTRRDGTKYDANAGMWRNQKMLALGKPVLVIAFPGGPGTANMCLQARSARVQVKEFAPK